MEREVGGRLSGEGGGREGLMGRLGRKGESVGESVWERESVCVRECLGENMWERERVRDRGWEREWVGERVCGRESVWERETV